MMVWGGSGGYWAWYGSHWRNLSGWVIRAKLSFRELPDGQRKQRHGGGKGRGYAACSKRVLWTRERLTPRASAISRMVCPSDRKAWRRAESMVMGFLPTRKPLARR